MVNMVNIPISHVAAFVGGNSLPSLVGGGTEGHACYDAGAQDQVSTFLSGGKPDCQVGGKQINDLGFSWFRIG